ncbi:multidrug/biocide efflux PACE transporter [Pseudomonas xanthosomatis]|uniref:multidrug/biocide efflux PACE transporter n=1 Tax=Pseudomonas xanthosomatis TaxID=2842356 RepID=UPI001C3D78FC|nr:multidrug/biocide efflux PACE transporter [Pseudomonas xanthosomatis]QXH44873.1 multidrug/biocide efflux PACE transporter [Pseudomonas xanthosomatis]
MQGNRVSLTERLTHAIGYEIGAVVLSAPVMAWVFDKPMETTGALALVISLIAMGWNMAYNALVDRFVSRPRSQWRFTNRLLHGLGFEGGIIVLCLPVAMWMLDIGLVTAFMLEAGFFVFILPYTVLYNWGFDKLKQQLSGNGSGAQTS